MGPPLLAAAVALLVALFAWHGADLPNQVYRSTQYERYGLLAFDTHWYGGFYPFTYSLLTPALGSIIGLRALGILSAVAATLAYSRLVDARRDAGRALSASVFAVGTAVPLLIGQLTFLAGMAVGMWTLVVLAGHRRRLTWLAAGVLALACTVTSPLAGLFLVLALLAWSITDRGRRARHLAVLIAAAAPLLVSMAAFSQPGSYSFPVQQLLTVLLCSAIGWLVVPPQWRALRVGIALYGLVAVGAFAVANPVGGNVVRLGSYVAPALLIAACWPYRRKALAIVLLPALIWQWSTGVYAVADAHNDPTRSREYFQPLVDRVSRMPQGVRLEIPFTSQHWEAAYVAPKIPLARGWERQLDVANNPLFYDATPLTPAAYKRWLYDNGVTAVALPDSPLDSAGKKEAALIRQGLPYLRVLWKNRNWTLWAVTGSPGLVSGPARLSASSPSGFTLEATAPATVTVRYRFTRTWSVAEGEACIEPTAAGWTKVRLLEPGRVTISAKPFSGSAGCPEPGSGR